MSTDQNAIMRPAAGPNDLAINMQDRGESLFAVIDDRLRGRWRLAILIGIILGTIAAACGYYLSRPKYESLGYIRIAPRISPLLRETEETGMMPHYTNFVQTQARRLESRVVLEEAIKDEALIEALPMPLSTVETVRLLDDGRTVVADRSSELIAVQFMGDTPAVAQAAVNAILQAYETLYGADRVTEKIEALRRIRLSKRGERRSLYLQMQEIAQTTRWGTDDMAEIISIRVRELDRSERLMESIEQALLLADSGAVDGGAEFDPANINDDLLRRLESERNRLWIELESAGSRWSTEHPGYRRAKDALDDAQLRLEAYIAELREVHSTSGQQLILVPALSSDPLPRLALERELLRLGRESEEHLDVIRRSSGHQRQFAELRAEIEELEADLAEFDTRLKYMEIERDAGLSDRISIDAYGELPLGPSQDRRRKLAAAGMVGGFMASIAVFFLLGTLDRKAFNSRQLRRDDAGFRYLGILPDLSRCADDPGARAMAAHCVHQIRNQIDCIVTDDDRCPVLAISSPFQGDGKSSIVRALGSSYAAAGYRTLLVDCDLVGEGLTAQLDLIESEGLRESLRRGSVNGRVVHAGSDNLDVLPSGRDATVGPESVTRRDLARLITELREKYEVILIDTGPMPGSLETTPITRAVDGIVLALRRGRSRTQLHQCIEHLEGNGANVLGVIMNCAMPTDCQSYVSASTRLSVRRLVDD